MAGDPPDVGGAEVDIAGVVVEDQLVGHGGIHHVTAGGVEDALGFSGGARGVEDEEGVFGAHPLVGAGGALAAALLVEPEVATGLHADLGGGAASHEHGLDQVETLHRTIHRFLEAQLAAAAQSLVGGHHQAGAGVEDAVADRLGAEAAEDDGMDRADAGAGEHGVGQLGDHRHVDADPVAPAHAVVAEDVGDPADLVFELAVGDVLVLSRLVLDPDDGVLIAPLLEVAVDAVVAGVEAAAEVPPEIHVVVIVVVDRVPGVEPGDALGLPGPEGLGIVEGQTVEPLVLLHRPDVGVFGDVRLWRNPEMRIFSHVDAPR